MTYHYVVMAGTKLFACYMSEAPATEMAAFLTDAHADNIAVKALIPGVDGDPATTCDNYLKGADAIVTETVAILNA